LENSLITSDDGKSQGIREITQGPPSGYVVIAPERQVDQEFDIAEFFSIALTSWKMLLGTALVGAAIAAGISLIFRDTYRAEVVIAPVSQKGASVSSALRGQLGGLASLAGIDLGGGDERKEESFATLASSGFARDFILSENLLPVLFAERWDAKNNRWRASRKPPTVGDAVKLFTDDVRFISQDRKTGLVKVAVEWYSPDLAARWANHMVEMANERLRTEATRDAAQSIDYLNKELEKTNVVELRQAIYRLIEDQVSRAMLANVQRQYAFRVIDSAVPPEFRSRPKRVLFVVVGALLGLAAAWLVSFLRRPDRASGARGVPGP
jgi:LPS O-antigen subunit length determinant protein (WzzB/FepE family)